MSDPVLTVIIPVYNEAASVARALDAVAAEPHPKQIVVVDDGSTDGSDAALRSWVDRAGAGVEIEVVRHPVNRGKGRAIRTGLERARAPVCLIQDADLEYDPADYRRLLEPILGGRAEAVYGSRYLAPGNASPGAANRLCVGLLNTMVHVLYGQRLTDEATCYKAFPTELLRRMDLCCERFEFCPEATAKALRMGVTIHEVPISYRPRSSREGKKIRWWDGVEAIATLVRWRWARFPGAAGAAGSPRQLALGEAVTEPM